MESDGVEQSFLSLSGAAINEEAFSDDMSTRVMDSIEIALTLPGQSSDVVSFRESFVGASSDEVSRLGSEMVSGGVSGEEGSQDPMQHLISRVESLYTEITVFQVAWSIARRVQQDTSQLLRGQ